MALFSFFEKNTPEEEMERAKAAFEKVAALRSDSRDARSARVRMWLLCRAHLEKTFIYGAEQTALWQDLVAVAISKGQELPELPDPPEFQQTRVGEADVYIYLPEEYAQEAFTIGSKYQKTEFSRSKAIQEMQALADKICKWELRLDETYQILQFLRDEEAEESGESGDSSGAAADPPEGSR